MPKNNIRRKAQLGLAVTDGGILTPVGKNIFLAQGRTHDEGGIGVTFGKHYNPNGNLEIENGEAVQIIGNENVKFTGNNKFKSGGQAASIRVFSSVPFLRGVSPAQLVMGGANPDIVFKAQEEFKDRNRINDDGTHYKTGGEKRVYTPSESIQQQLQKTGKITLGGSPIIGAPKTIGYLRNMINLKHINNRAGYPFRRLARYVKGNVNKARDAGEITKEQSKRMKYIYDQVIGENGESLPRTVGLLTEDKQMKFGGNMIYEINGNVKNTLGSYRPKGQYGLATKYLKKKDKNVEKPIEIKQNNENKILDVRNTTGYKLKQVSQNPWIKYPVDVLSFFLTGAGGKTIQGVKTAAKDIAIKRAFTPSNKNLSKPVDKVTEFINKNKTKIQNNKTIEVGTLENPIKPYAENRTINTYAATENELAKAAAKTAKKQIKPQSIDKIYKKVVGNKEPRSTVGNKPLWTEISYVPTNKPITAYDASVEFHKRISNMLYNDLVKKYGKKGVDKAMKAEHISKYKYGGRIKAENGKFLKYKNGVFTDPKTGEQFDVDPEVFKMYGNTFEEGVIPTADYTKGTFDNARPQFFAEKRIGLFGDKSLAEKAGLARSGWSYGSTPTINYIPDINLSIPEDYGKGVKRQTNSTPRRGDTQAKSISNINNIPTITSKLKSNDSTYDVSQLGSPATKQAKAKLNTSSTGGGTQSNTNERWVGQYKPVTTADWIGLGSNLAGSVASYFLTKNLINKAPDPIKPVMAPIAKLKTRYNITPQLAEVKESEQVNRGAVRRNTQSSNVSLAREQRLMNEARTASNKLYGQKENIETQLINQDRLNRQTVAGRNVAIYNDYLNRLIGSRKEQNQLRISNINNLLSGLTGSVNNILGNIESRRATNNTLRAIAVANPNVDARLIGSFDYYIDPITKRKYNKNQQYIGTING